MLSYGSSLDCPGVITRTTLDAAVVLDSLIGYDPRDPTSIKDVLSYEADAKMYTKETNSEISFLLGKNTSNLLASSAGPRRVSEREMCELYNAFCGASTNLSGVNIGIPEEFSVDGMSGEVHSVWADTIKILEDAGAKIHIVSLPSLKMSLPCYYVLACAEASSNLSRYDGIRYGYRAASERITNADDSVKYEKINQSSEQFFRELKQTRGEGFGPEVIRRILTGTFVLSQGAYEDFFETAAQCRLRIHKEINRCLSGDSEGSIHALLGPTSPILPYHIDSAPDPSHMLLSDLYTIQANLAGVPAVTVPVGVSRIMSHELLLFFTLCGAPRRKTTTYYYCTTQLN